MTRSGESSRPSQARSCTHSGGRFPQTQPTRKQQLFFAPDRPSQSLSARSTNAGALTPLCQSCPWDRLPRTSSLPASKVASPLTMQTVQGGVYTNAKFCTFCHSWTPIRSSAANPCQSTPSKCRKPSILVAPFVHHSCTFLRYHSSRPDQSSKARHRPTNSHPTRLPMR
jgi:hypothetical protein